MSNNRPFRIYEITKDQKQFGKWEEYVPSELQLLTQWVTWRYEWNSARSKWIKVPYVPETNKRADVTNCDDWEYFDLALCYVQADFRTGIAKYDGLGFVLTEADDIVCVDLDNCRDHTTGVIEEWATQVIERLDSYTEISPSGTGVHIFMRGRVPKDGSRSNSIEVYQAKRYIAVTAHILDNRCEVQERSEELMKWYEETFPLKRQYSRKPSLQQLHN